MAPMLTGCASLVGTGNFYQPWSGANPNWDFEVQLVKLNLESLRIRLQLHLGGGFKYFLFSARLGEMIQFD